MKRQPAMPPPGEIGRVVLAQLARLIRVQAARQQQVAAAPVRLRARRAECNAPPACRDSVRRRCASRACGGSRSNAGRRSHCRRLALLGNGCMDGIIGADVAIPARYKKLPCCNYFAPAGGRRHQNAHRTRCHLALFGAGMHGIGGGSHQPCAESEGGGRHESRAPIQCSKCLRQRSPV